VGLPASTLTPLQRVQHAVARIVFRIKRQTAQPCISSFAAVALAASRGEDPVQVMFVRMLGVTHARLHRRSADATIRQYGRLFPTAWLLFTSSDEHSHF